MSVRRVWGIAAVLLGIVCWIAAIWVAASSLTSAAAFGSSSPTTVALTQGSWTVFQIVPEGSEAVLPADVAKERTLTVEQLKVTGPNGSPVTLTCAYCTTGDTSAIPLDLRLANPVATFQASEPGDYTVTVASGAAPAQLAVANPVAKIQEIMPWFTALGIAGMALFVIGVLFIIVGRAPPSQVTVQPATEDRPPGWYPNPYQPGTDSQMWWDGTKWTSNWR